MPVRRRPPGSGSGGRFAPNGRPNDPETELSAAVVNSASSDVWTILDQVRLMADPLAVVSEQMDLHSDALLRRKQIVSQLGLGPTKEEHEGVKAAEQVAMRNHASVVARACRVDPSLDLRTVYRYDGSPYERTLECASDLGESVMEVDYVDDCAKDDEAVHILEQVDSDFCGLFEKVLQTDDAEVWQESKEMPEMGDLRKSLNGLVGELEESTDDHAEWVKDQILENEGEFFTVLNDTIDSLRHLRKAYFAEAGG